MRGMHKRGSMKGDLMVGLREFTAELVGMGYTIHSPNFDDFIMPF